MNQILHFNNIFKQLLLIVIVLLCSLSNSYAGKIKDLRIGQGMGTVRIVFDSDSKFDYKVFTLNSPRRLVVDTQGIDVNHNIVSKLSDNAFVENARIGSTGVDGIRIAFDLKRPIIIKKAIMLPPQSNFSWRFAIDLETSSDREFSSNIGNNHALSSNDYNKTVNVKQTNAVSPAIPRNNATRKIIVIDAGHGGADPGAIGYKGTYEKNITLAMAKELKSLLDKKGKYKVYLTRNRDFFIPLRKRVDISRHHDANLFISIHADSAKNRKAVGLSVYTLSKTASDKEAAALAEKENKSDIVAGVNFAGHPKEVGDILIDLAQRETNNSSAYFASLLSKEMSKIVKTVSNTHRFAGFAVLKAPDVPSVLLELGYLSNPSEERQLRQKSYRNKLAQAAIKAIDKYFQTTNY